MKLFYTGPVINVEMLIVMLEKHGIVARQEFEDSAPVDREDLNRMARVFVSEADFPRAHELFYGDRGDEI